MRRRHIAVEATSAGAPADVFALLADATSWPAWSPIDTVVLERRGDGEPEGVGAIRVNTRGRTVGRDEVVELVPGRRFAYRSLSGLPVRDYRAAVDLEAAGDGTHIRWTASFDPRYPGTGFVLERGIAGFLRQCAEGLAAHAGRRPTG